MSDIVKLDLDKFNEVLQRGWMSDSKALCAVARACAEKPEPPEPPATPNLELLYRFAKVAGWKTLEGSGGAMGHLGDGLAVSFPVYQGRVPMTGMVKLYEYDAGEWLDSPEALDAAAIVAVRRGRSWIEDRDISTGDRSRFRILTQQGEAVGPWIDPRPRAAVLACLAAFEAKS